MSSTRLKPEEAASILQEDGDEARLGGISLQIMAVIQQPQRTHDAITAAAAASTPLSSIAATRVGGGDGGGVKAGTASRLGGLATGGSGFRRGKLGAARRSLLPAAAAPLASGGDGGRSGGSSSAAVGAASRAAVVGVGPSTTGSVKRAGLGVTGRGVGGAGRFHAPRSFYSAAAAERETTPNANSTASVSARREGSSCGLAEAGGRSPRFAGAGRDSGAAAATAVAVANTPPGGSSGNREDGVHEAAAVSPEGLVLEWTAGDPPRPLLAGASLARRLHPHQREGLKVLWECLAGRGG